MFEKLLEALFNSDAETSTKAFGSYAYLGWWITPTDKKLDAHGKNEHWMIVKAHPGYFGLNSKDPIFKTERTHKFTQMAIDAGAIRVAKTPQAYFIDSTEINKATVDRLWFAFSDLDTKELIWDCKVPFRGKTLWKGTLDELEPLVESKLVESHSHSKCMKCDMKPTKEVLWAEGMGHAWFCNHCFNEWKKTHKGDICSLKDINDGKAAKKFSENTNPNLLKEAKTDRELFENLRELNEEDLFPNATEEEVVKRKEEAKRKEEEELAKRWAEGPIDIHLLFDTLVAPQGKSETVEGELVRAISKVGYRYNNDGDYFYKGYGKETAGPAVRYLKAKAKELHIPELSKALTFMSSRRETDAEQFENGPYAVGLEAAVKAVVDYVVSKNKQFTPNTEDMHDYEVPSSRPSRY